jgi:hypothetical protein
LTIFRSSSTFLCLLWRNSLNTHNFKPPLVQVRIEKTTQTSAFYPWHCHRKLFWIFYAIFYTVLPQVQNKASDNCIVSSDHPVRQRRSQLTNINTHSEVIRQRIKPAKQTGVYQKTAILLHLPSYTYKLLLDIFGPSDEFGNCWMCRLMCFLKYSLILLVSLWNSNHFVFLSKNDVFSVKFETSPQVKCTLIFIFI